MIFTPDNIELSLSWRFFGKRYLKSSDFISLCDLVGLKSVSDDELEEYEKNKLLFPAARIIMPDDYAFGFWESQHTSKRVFIFDDKYIEFNDLDWALRFPNHNETPKNYLHPIDNNWGLEGLQKPSENEFVPWDNFYIQVKIDNNTFKEPSATHYYHYWQIYELFEARKLFRKMYKDNNYLVQFREFNHSNSEDLNHLFDALSFFQTNFIYYQKEFLRERTPNDDGIIILDKPEQKRFSNCIKLFALETINRFKLSDEQLFLFLRKIMELYSCYENSERTKLSHTLKKDIWNLTEFIQYVTGMDTLEISKRAGRISIFLKDYLELLFPNRRLQAREESTNFINHYIKEYNKICTTMKINEIDIENFFNYSEIVNISWFEYVITELNKEFHKFSSWHHTITFIYLKMLASLPETLMRIIIQDKSDDQTKQKLENNPKAGMGKLIEFIFCDSKSNILHFYNKYPFWNAKNKRQFLTNLSKYNNKITMINSEFEFIGANLALATLIRNFSSHLVLDDPNLLQGQYVFCIRSLINSICAIWVQCTNNNWGYKSELDQKQSQITPRENFTLTKTEILKLVTYCKNKLNFNDLVQAEAYGYQNLPLCIIDAVFSIGVRYTSTENTVKRFCNHFDVTRLREKDLDPQSEQLSVSSFIQFHEGFTFQEMAEKIYQNKQRTSTRNGILKAEAAYRFASVVQKFDVEYLQDVEKILGNEKFEAEIARIPGQGSGLSTRYFYMLAGDENFIKPDRMIRRFIQAAISRELSMQDCQELLLAAHAELVRDYPLLTPRSLDHQIWVHQRQPP